MALRTVSNQLFSEPIQARVSTYVFDDATDVTPNAVAPSGTPISTAQNIAIPAKGVIEWCVTGRAEYTGSVSSYTCMGLRIDGTDYFAYRNANGNLGYFTSFYIPASETYNEALNIHSSAYVGEVLGIDIVARGLSEGTKTVQPVLAGDPTLPAYISTMKGTVVPTRFLVKVFDFT